MVYMIDRDCKEENLYICQPKNRTLIFIGKYEMESNSFLEFGHGGCFTTPIKVRIQKT